jgi:signal transduction histidine kinase
VHAERRRIARELHDVVAHHISVMNVLVGAARTTMSLDPARAEEVLATTEQTAREAMAEMRQLLAVLRADDEDEPTPQARTAQLPTLVARTCEAGLPTQLRVTGDSRPLPAAADLAVYRIVQEALTNTRKHTQGASAQVRLSYQDGAVEVEVLDDGGTAGHGTALSPGGGYGLSGMAERVALCGGALQAGPRERGGFRVHARLPLPAATPAPEVQAQ